MMHLLITGGTGLIGQRLIDQLLPQGYTITVLSRRSLRPPRLPNSVNFAQWDASSAAGWGHLLEEVDGVVNLAGAGVADSPWTKARKQLIRESRLLAGQAVVEAINAAKNKPRVLLQASAVGYYGSDETATMTETSPPGDDFLANVCQDWENSVKPVEALGVRVVYLRTGVVLDPRGGAFPKLMLPFRMFVGGPLGNGLQWMSWIHHQDQTAIIRFLLENDSLSGPVNLVAPDPLRNADFAKLLGKVMQRPAVAPAPGFIIRTVMGEMSTIVLDGQRVLPEKLSAAGYQFIYPQAEAALRELVNSSK